MEDLEKFLLNVGVETEIIYTGVETYSVEAAAQALVTDVEAIVKSVVFEGRRGEVVIAIAGGGTRVDTRKLATVTGINGLRLARPEVVLARTGYPAGGTPPVGHRERLPVVMDTRVLRLPVVFGGGGSPEKLLRIAPADIVRLTGAVVADISVAGP